MREVDADDVAVRAERADLAQPSQLLGEGAQVEVVGAVPDVVAERLLEQQHVEAGVAHRVDGLLRQRAGVGGVEQPPAGPRDVVEHARPRLAVGRGVHPDVVLPEAVALACPHRHEPHGRVRRDPHPGLLDDLRRPEHVERRLGDPGAEQQERRRAVVRVGVGEQHVAQPGEVQACALRRLRGGGAAVQQQHAVEQRRRLAAQQPGRPGRGAGGAAAVRVGPAVGRAGAEQREVHVSNSATASNAARRDARRSARSSAVPASATTRKDSTARPRSHGSEVVT